MSIWGPRLGVGSSDTFSCVDKLMVDGVEGSLPFSKLQRMSEMSLLLKSKSMSKTFLDISNLWQKPHNFDYNQNKEILLHYLNWKVSDIFCNKYLQNEYI